MGTILAPGGLFRSCERSRIRKSHHFHRAPARPTYLRGQGETENIRGSGIAQTSLLRPPLRKQKPQRGMWSPTTLRIPTKYSHPVCDGTLSRYYESKRLFFGPEK